MRLHVGKRTPDGFLKVHQIIRVNTFADGSGIRGHVCRFDVCQFEYGRIRVGKRDRPVGMQLPLKDHSRNVVDDLVWCSMELNSGFWIWLAGRRIRSPRRSHGFPGFAFRRNVSVNAAGLLVERMGQLLPVPRVVLTEGPITAENP